MSLLRASLTRFVQRSPIFSTSLLALDIGLYAFMVVGAVIADDVWLKLVLGIAAGAMASLTSIVGHDAGHQSLSTSRRLNRILGTIAFLPALHPFSLWKHHHNRVHHVFTAQLGVDNAFPPMTVAQYRSASRWKRLRYRFTRSIWGQPFCYLLDVWLPHMFLPNLLNSRHISRDTWWDIAIVYAWFAAFLAATTALTLHVHEVELLTAAASAFFFACAIPFLVWNAVISFLAVVQHTAPNLRWSESTGRPSTVKQSIEGTVHVQFPSWLDTVMHRIMRHPVHHLNVEIPLQRLSEAEAHLESMVPEIRTVRWSISYHLELTRRCQLYEPRANRWVTFDEAEKDLIIAKVS